MRTFSMLLLPLVATPLVLSLAGCGDDDASASGGGGSASTGGDGGGQTSASVSTGSTSSSAGTTSSSTGGFVPGGPVCSVADPAARELACSRYAQAACDYYPRCAPGLGDFVWGSYEACISNVTGDCSKSVNVREDLYLECYEATEVALGASDCSGNPFFEARAKCVGIGVLADGQSCGEDEECASGHCEGEEACGICAPAKGVGEPCTLSCGRRIACLDGVCVAPVEGDACDEFGLGVCDDGSVCTGGTCRRGLSVGAGEDCDGERWCDTTAGLVCAGGTCEPFARPTAGVGDECEPTPISFFGVTVEFPVCAEGLRCNLNTIRCEAPRLEGAQCSDDADCVSFYCLDGACSLEGRCPCTEE